MPKKKAAKSKSPKKQKKSPFLAWKIIIILIALLSLVSLYFINNYRENKQIKSDPVKFENKTLEGLNTVLETNAKPREYNYDDWILENGERVPLKSQQIILGTNGINDVGKYGNLSTNDLNQVNKEFLEKLQIHITQYFLAETFSKNLKNTNTIPDPNTYYFSTYAFSKNNIYCLSHVAKESDPFGYISCGTIDTEQMNKQKELENVYKLEQAQNKNPITFRVDKIEKGYASGSTSPGIGGYQWIAQNVEGTWQRIWAGQDFPLCSDMAQYQVPKEFYPGCYNPETQKEQRTYN